MHITGLGHANTLGIHHSNAENTNSKNAIGSDILDRKSYDLKLEKSNILLLGPTGSGKYILLVIKNAVLINYLPYEHAQNMI